MQRKVSKFVIVAALFALSNCSSGVRDTLGLRRSAPDEFRVVSNAPLSLPPEFTLRPPMPGAKRPQELELDKQAKDILLQGSVQSNDTDVSKGESVFLKKANVQDANPEIKEVLIREENDEDAAEKKKGFWDKFATLTHLKSKKDPTVNATKEKERISENKKEGKPVNEGEVPVVKERSGLLKNVFGF